MNIAKRYRWMVLDHKGRLKRPDDYQSQNPNGWTNGEFDSPDKACSHLDTYIAATDNAYALDYVLVTFYTKD